MKNGCDRGVDERPILLKFASGLKRSLARSLRLMAGVSFSARLLSKRPDSCSDYVADFSFIAAP